MTFISRKEAEEGVGAEGPNEGEEYQNQTVEEIASRLGPFDYGEPKQDGI